MARTEMYTPARGDRPNSPDVIIVMTDGASNVKKVNTIPEAQRCKDDDMTLLVVGVTKRVNPWELRGIASHKDYVFQVDQFSKLKDTLEDLVAKSCRATDGEVVYVDDDDGADKNAPDIFVPVCYSQADVVFVLDASSSIEKAKFGNWQLMKYLAGKLTKSLEFGTRGFKVSVILYSDDATIYFDLNEHSQKRPALDAIYNMKYLTGNTNTQKALNVLRTQGFTRNHGDRRRVTNIAIFISDGASNVHTENTLPEAARAKSDGITIFSVGVGHLANYTEIDGIASGPEFVFHLNELSQIGQILMDVATKCCEFVRRRAQT